MSDEAMERARAADPERWREECSVCGIAVRDWVFGPSGGYLCDDCDDDGWWWDDE